MSCLPSLSDLTSLFSASTSSYPSDSTTVDILTLGSGWTGSFLTPIAQQSGLSIKSTTRDGSNSTIPFLFDPQSESSAPFFKLPNAKTVVIIFPVYETESMLKLVRFYRQTRQEGSEESAFLLLGSTGIWDNGPTFQSLPPSYTLSTSDYLPEKKHPLPPSPTSPWLDRHSPYDLSNPRAQSEDQLLSLSEPSNPISELPIKVSVLCLSGLWGHGRSPRRFVSISADSKEKLKAMKSVHLVHGRDVARAIIAIHKQWEKTQGQRWMLTNERVYDLWDLASRFGNAGEAGRDHPPQGPQPLWVQELMAESLSEEDPNQSIRALPRSVEQMGKGLDGSEFWNTFGLVPEVPWVD